MPEKKHINRLNEYFSSPHHQSANGELSAHAVCLDLGECKIRALAGFINEQGKVEILGFAETDSVGIQKGVVVNHRKTQDALKTVINDLVLLSGLSTKEVWVTSAVTANCFNYRTSCLRQHTTSPVSKEDIQALWNTSPGIELPPGEQVILSSLYNISLNAEDKGSSEGASNGNRLNGEFQAVSCRISDMENISGCLDKAGLQIAGFIPSFTAVAASVLSEEEYRQGAVVLDWGHSSTRVIVCREGRVVYTATVPFGGSHITEDIKAGFQISTQEAEVVKIKVGSAYSPPVKSNEIATLSSKADACEIHLKTLSLIIQARIEEILDMVMLEIKNSGYDHRVASGFILCGGGALQKNIVQLVKAYTGMEVRIGYPVQRLSSGTSRQLRSPEYATCIGMVIAARGTANVRFFNKPSGIMAGRKIVRHE
ncbi:MAG: cell division protein FtsA [Chitinophagales bacterium]|nr:MAG: cell division protein FtsA [Chitinophagales bacterium]